MMRSKLPSFSLRALTVAATLSSLIVPAVPVEAGVLHSDYAVQQYLDFAVNKGIFSAGATNVSVYKADGTTSDYVIPLMPSLASYAYIYGYSSVIGDTGGAGGNLIGPQYVATALHVRTTTDSVSTTQKIGFLGNDFPAVNYDVAGYRDYARDGSTIRLNKIVTEVTYNPACVDDEMLKNLRADETLIFRVGQGQRFLANPDGGTQTPLSVGTSRLGGTQTASSVNVNETTGYMVYARLDLDAKNPLDIGALAGDSGSPMVAFNKNTNQFEFIGAMSALTSTSASGYGNTAFSVLNSKEILATKDYFDSDKVDVTNAGTVVVWNTSGTLTQGSASWDYHGVTNGHSGEASRGVVFSNTDSSPAKIELQDNINMGYGSLTFTKGIFELGNASGGNFNVASAGFIVETGATLKTTLNGSGEWRKVGAGTLLISGTGDNANLDLNVGGGVARYEVLTDDRGNITGYRQLREGETRLDREGGYAAKSIKLSAGVETVVLMRDGQIKDAASFTFGASGGLLNMNGQNLEWDTINHQDTGAVFGNVKLTDAAENHVQQVSTFTYTGTGTFKGKFTDGESESGKSGNGELNLVYKGAGTSSAWTLTGTSHIAGAVSVESGVLTIQGRLTEHVKMTDVNDWVYASFDSGKGFAVKNGASLVLGHHALVSGNITVEDGGTFVMNQTANIAQESVGGSLRQDMNGFFKTSLDGNVVLLGINSKMKVEVNSEVATVYTGDISGAGNFEKTGSGTLKLSGKNTFTGTKNIQEGIVEFASKDSLGGSAESTKWTIGTAGTMILGQAGGDDLRYIDSSSSGIFALGQGTQATQVGLNSDNSTLSHNKLFIGAAAGTVVEYGTKEVNLVANSEKQWLLGGGGGKLNVNFKLTGDNSLVIGNKTSAGTVYLANEANDFTGSIIIGGVNNILEFVSEKALGNASISVNYGNAMNIFDATGKAFEKVNAESAGVLSIFSEQGTVSQNIDLGTRLVTLGAVGETHYTGTLTANSTHGYRLGGQGTLVLDTILANASKMAIDGQGFSGGSVVFAKNQTSFTGAIEVGGALQNSGMAGTVGVNLLYGNELGNIEAITFKKGGQLWLSAEATTLKNASFETGSAIINNDATDKVLKVNMDSGKSGTLAMTAFTSGNTALPDGASRGIIDLVKIGSGKLVLNDNGNSYAGTITVKEGSVVVSSTYNNGLLTSLGSANLVLEKSGTAELTLNPYSGTGKKIEQTVFTGAVSGDGTLQVDGKGSTILLWNGNPNPEFTGTVRLTGNTRLLIGTGDNHQYTATYRFDNASAFDGRTIEVLSGSQAVISPAMDNYSMHSGNVPSRKITTSANFIINGASTNAGGAGNYQTESFKGGALRVDLGATVTGSVTLGSDATIASYSRVTGNMDTQSYGIASNVGGTITGAILGGANKTLTLGGNEGLTFRADATSNYGNLNIANGNGNTGFALRVNGGAEKSTTSTALGGGTVTIKDGLLVNFGNAGTANNSVVYTYGNNFSAGNNVTLKSEYNTTNLTGTVALTGTTLNLETKNGSVLRLAGGLSGSGKTVNINSASNIVLGGDSTSGFGGTIDAGAGTNLTLLASAAGDTALGSDVTLNFTDSLNLTLEGTNTFNFSSIVGTPSSEATTGTNVKLTYDFTSGTAGGSLASTTFTVGNVSVYLNLNGTEDLRKGTYTLYTGDVNDTTFTLASTNLNGRVTLETKDNTVTLVVGDDVRLFRKYDASNKAWDKSSALWTSDTNKTVFSDNDSVVFGKDGVAENNSAISRETISIASDVAVTSLAVKDGKYYSFDGIGKITASEKLNVYGASLELKNGANTFAAVMIGGDGGDSATAHGELVAAKTGVLTNSAISLGTNGTLTLSSEGTLAGTTKVSFDGGTLKYGSGNIGDISAFLVKGSGDANIDLNGQSVILEAPAAFSAGTMNFSNSSESTGTATLGFSSAMFTVSGGSTINVGEKTTIKHYASGTLGKLSGAGTYEIDGSSALTLSAVSDFSGTLVKSGSGTTTISSDFTVENLTVNAGTFKLMNSEATSGRGKILKNVTLSGGVLQTHNGAQPTAATVIDKLTLAGASAELSTTHFQGYWQVKDLASSGSGVNGTLILSSSHSATVRTIFELGDSGNLNAAQGDFTGSLSLKSTDSGTYRSSSLVISDANIAKNAKVDLSVCNSGTGVLSLGVNANSVTIAGLSSTLGVAKAKVYSGKVGTQTTDGNGGSNGVTKTSYGDGTKRTLEINTAAGTNTSFNGEILANLSLVKTGAGTQTLAGASTTFDGGVSVQEGTLIAAHANALGIGAVSVKTGATLQANTAITFSTEAQTLTLFVGADDIESIVPVGEIQLRNGAGSSSQSLVTSGNGGSLTVSGASTVYIDVSALAGTTVTLPGNEFSLKLAAETALTFNDENARVGWWDESGTLWTDWALVSQYAYNADSGLMTLTVPEPSAFGSLVGLGALALVASRRRRSRRS